MTREEFLHAQYQTLREEIRETKSRIFRTVGFGLTVIPAADYLAKTYKVTILVITMPILVVVVGLVYLSENHALMRCGRYIRLHIESKVESKVVGWEQWLTTPDEFEKRSVDRYLTYSFYLLFAVYFVGSVFLATTFTRVEYGVLLAVAVAAGYGAGGVIFAVFLVRNIHMSTTTKADENRTSS